MDPQWLSIGKTVISHLFYFLRFLLIRLFYILGWLLTPLLLVGRVLLALLVFPFSVLVRFETFFLFFGVAVGVGLLLGISLHLLIQGAVLLLDLDRRNPKVADRHTTGDESDELNTVTGHSAASYRAAQARKRLDEAKRRATQARLLVSKPVLGVTGDRRKGRANRTGQQGPASPRQRSGLLSTTILEEVDDSEGEYGF